MRLKQCSSRIIISSFVRSVSQCVGIILEQDQCLGVQNGHEKLLASYDLISVNSAAWGSLSLNIKIKAKQGSEFHICLLVLMLLSEQMTMAKTVEWPGRRGWGWSGLGYVPYFGSKRGLISWTQWVKDDGQVVLCSLLPNQGGIPRRINQ